MTIIDKVIKTPATNADVVGLWLSTLSLIISYNEGFTFGIGAGTAST